MVDIESTQPPQGIGGPSPTNTPIVQLQRLAYLLIAGGLLHKPFNAYRVVLLSPHVSHEWFKLGLAGTIGKARQENVGYSYIFHSPLVCQSALGIVRRTRPETTRQLRPLSANDTILFIVVVADEHLLFHSAPSALWHL